LITLLDIGHLRAFPVAYAIATGIHAAVTVDCGATWLSGAGGTAQAVPRLP
jgi:hypothetical protein